MAERMLQDRVAVVTGAGRGLGRAYALRLAAYGAKVLVNDSGVAADGTPTAERPAAEVVAEIAGSGGTAITHTADIATMEGGRDLIQRAIDEWGRLDIVVNNAGIGRPKMVFNLDEAEWDDVIRVHLKGTFAVSQPACRWWRDRAKTGASKFGRLINTATGLLVATGAGQSNYVAAKGGIAAFTDAVATEMEPYGVTVNAILPSAMTRLAGVGWRIGRQQAPDLPYDPTDPVHVAEFIAYLASPAADWISGQMFQVRGAIVEHVSGWHVARTMTAPDHPFTASELAAKMQRWLGAGPKPADPPPKQWRAEYEGRKQRGKGSTTPD